MCDINEDGITDQADLMYMKIAVRSGDTNRLPESCDFDDNDYALLEYYLISIDN